MNGPGTAFNFHLHHDGKPGPARAILNHPRFETIRPALEARGYQLYKNKRPLVEDVHFFRWAPTTAVAPALREAAALERLLLP